MPHQPAADGKSTPQLSPPAWRRIQGPQICARTGPVGAATSVWEHPVRGRRLEALEVVASDWCTVVAVTPDDHVILVRQFRFGTGRLSLETPGGVVDEGESAASAAARELFEETGYRGDTPELLSRVHANPALQANLALGFLVQNASFVGGHTPDADEDIEVLRVAASAVPGLIAAGEVHHALIVVALQAWLLRRATQA